jgi:CheY-like chemotaxis protein
VSDFRIVLVEDNAPDAVLIKDALQHHGLAYTLQHYTNGEDAAKAIAAAVDAPDLFLLDLNVPRLDGFELLRIIRELPLMADVPVAIITSSRAAGDRAESEQLGANAYIVKPTSYADFKTQVGQAIVELLQRKARAVCARKQPASRALGRYGCLRQNDRPQAASRRSARLNVGLNLASRCVLGDLQIVVRLKVDPELRACPEVSCQSEGCVRCDRPPAVHDLAHTGHRHAKLKR